MGWLGEGRSAEVVIVTGPHRDTSTAGHTSPLRAESLRWAYTQTHTRKAGAGECKLPPAYPTHTHTHADTVDTIWIVIFGKLLLISLHTNAPFNLLTLLSINFFKITLKLFIFYLCLQEIENPFRLLLLLRCCGWQTQLKLETHTERKRESQYNWPEREQSRERQQRLKVRVREGKRTPLSSWESGESRRSFLFVFRFLCFVFRLWFYGEMWVAFAVVLLLFLNLCCCCCYPALLIALSPFSLSLCAGAVNEHKNPTSNCNCNCVWEFVCVCMRLCGCVLQ